MINFYIADKYHIKTVKRNFEEPDYDDSPKFDQFRKKSNNENSPSASKRYREDFDANNKVVKHKPLLESGMGTSRMMLGETHESFKSIEEYKFDRKDKSKKEKKEKRKKSKKRKREK